jgi:hypothetical protein
VLLDLSTKFGEPFIGATVLLDFGTNLAKEILLSSKHLQQRFVLAQQSQQDVFGRNMRAAVLACLIASEEDRPPGSLCIRLKHGGILHLSTPRLAELIL